MQQKHCEHQSWSKARPNNNSNTRRCSPNACDGVVLHVPKNKGRARNWPAQLPGQSADAAHSNSPAGRARQALWQWAPVRQCATHQALPAKKQGTHTEGRTSASLTCSYP